MRRDDIRELEQRAEVHTTPCGDGDLIWRRWGRRGARPVVLAHGGSGSWTHWLRTIPALIEADLAVWAPDLPGLGDSAMPHGPHTPATCAAVLAAGMTGLLRDERPVLIGFSWGAHISTLAAVELRERIAALVIVGSSALGLPDAGLAPFPKVRLGASQSEQDEVHRRTLEILMIRDPARIDDLAIAIQAENIARSRFRSREFARSDAIALALAHVDVPVAAIWGERDVLAVPSIDAVLPALSAYRRPDQSRIEWRQIPDAGHWVMWEQPAAFNAALREVLARI